MICHLYSGLLFGQISCLRFIHSHSYVHGDIKPQNILTGLGSDAQTIFIVDFGIAQSYHKSAMGDHIPFHHSRCLTGTPAFTSINSHLGAALGRHDDLESLTYVLIYLSRGSLPWLQANSVTPSSILRMKQEIPIKVLCSGLPCELAVFLSYTCNLSFSEEPDYNYVLFFSIDAGPETTNTH
jgi:serine/threonine protein kinase